MVYGEYELTTGKTVCEWWMNREDDRKYAIFTLNEDEAWEDKRQDIEETMRRMMHENST